MNFYFMEMATASTCSTFNLALFSSQTFHIECNFRYRRIFMDHITFKRRTRIIQRRFNLALFTGDSSSTFWWRRWTEQSRSNR